MLQAQIGDPQELVDIDLAAHLAELVVSFSRVAAEEAALADAENFEISEDLLKADKEKLAELGSFQALVDYHNNKQKENGLSVERIDQYLATDPHYAKIRTLVDKGVIIDTAADFQPIHRTAKLRNLQVRMLPVYRKAVSE
jgi:imidazolonepropionase-like amidohydrolase